MCSCMEEAITNPAAIVAAVDYWTLLLTVIATGIGGSFTHCIGMCGPIAISQMSMRMMHVQDIKPWSRIQCSFAIPYYIGKAITYALLAMMVAILGRNILSADTSTPAVAYISSIRKWILGGLAFAFIIAGIRILCAAPCGILFTKILNFRFLHIVKITWSIIKTIKLRWTKILGLDLISKKFGKFASNIKLKPFGVQGLLLGMILGLIPCGLVYSIIITIVSSSHGNIYMVGSYAFVFGLTTIPGLFTVSYFGQYILTKWRNYFSLLYGVSMLANAWLLLTLIG